MAWRISVALTTAALAGAVLVALAAAAPTRFVLRESVDFAGGNGPVGTFKATGIPSCGSGKFSDSLVSFSANSVIVDRAYTCGHRGGTFTAKMALHLSIVNQAGKQSGKGSWKIIHASGALHGLSATGLERGVARSCAPVGTVLAKCSVGTDTVTGIRKAR
ncbi:MAG: hypothetical protein QOK34_1137 [Gaiellaceae bacterium]|nr:hypothetical protein [Gaiellaceae bacterium]